MIVVRVLSVLKIDCDSIHNQSSMISPGGCMVAETRVGCAPTLPKLECSEHGSINAVLWLVCFSCRGVRKVPLQLNWL
jgi:hypothetical protein